jgi:hypothetical protein
MRHAYRLSALALALATPAFAQTYDGIDDYTIVTCGSELSQLTYTIRVVAMMPPAATPSTFGRAMYSAASGTTSTGYIYLGAPDNKLTPSVTHRSTTGFFTVEGPTPMNDGLFHTYCGIASAGMLHLYVDGREVGTPKSLSGAVASTRQLCTVGALRRSSGFLGSFWHGEITDVGLWNRALSGTEFTTFCGSIPPPGNPCSTGPRYGIDRLPLCDATHTTNCRIACTPERQLVPCGCSEDFEWTPTPDIAPNQLITHYEVQRTSSQGQSLTTLPVQVDEDGRRLHPNRWSFWKEPNWNPTLGVIYTYTVRACVANLCSTWGPTIDYAPAPHTVLP